MISSMTALFPFWQLAGIYKMSTPARRLWISRRRLQLGQANSDLLLVKINAVCFYVNAAKLTSEERNLS